MASETKKQYEISFLLKADGSAEAVADLLKKSGMEIVTEGRLNEIRLAYPIARENSARFGCIVFSSLPEDIAALKEKMPFLKDVIRFLIVTPPIAKSVRRNFGESGRPAIGVVPGEIPSETASAEKEAVPDSGEVNEVELDKKLEEILS